MAEAAASVLLLRAGLALLAWPVYLLSFLGIWEPFCRKVFFPFILEKICGLHEKKSKKHKQELFRNLPDFRGPSGELRLLEIGTGSGANFQFYPPGCKVTCTDINPNFQEGLSRNMKKNQHLHYEQFLVAAGEDLRQVPSGSVDAVVCTLVLCSVHSVSSTLREVLRVLRPVCYPTWKLVFAGCCLTRELWKNLEEAKFSELKIQHISVALPWMPIEPHIVGFGVK
ncbi:methyltransferase-like protein 7A isoform X2 [Onychostruthus taczanowskii]|uniref:methyltransferase-like protein 7A isoform X2 n=1 Tax=Onychostruthus taczanowskii TaxID=356909 RepID=UPI001B80855D|nr:methyltransferase-like protein 7A isoform X2 [Onychostruthus taczanowskii]